MSSTIKIRTHWNQKVLSLRILIEHPMENGRRLEEGTSKTLPAHFITHLIVMHNAIPVIHGQLTTGISKNPYFAFELEGVSNGDLLSVSWRDNLGQEDHSDIQVTPNRD